MKIIKYSVNNGLSWKLYNNGQEYTSEDAVAIVRKTNDSFKALKAAEPEKFNFDNYIIQIEDAPEKKNKDSSILEQRRAGKL